MRSILICFLSLLAPLALIAKEPAEKLAPIHHIIVFYLENHSFDNLFGTFPGADGIANAGDAVLQTAKDGKTYAFLPPVTRHGKPDPAFNRPLANKPFLITDYVKANDIIGDLVHRFYQTQAQIDGGKMDRFVAESDAGGLTMGYYAETQSPLWTYARNYTLADHFFTAAFGGSMVNHFWLICACTPRYEDAPDALRATLNENGALVKDGSLTPDGYVVNTIQPFNPPYNAKVSDASLRLPAQTLPTIGERLHEKGIGWAWYADGWNDEMAGKQDSGFVHHHHPFDYFANYAPGTSLRAEHLKDEADMVEAIKTGTLPAVAFYKPGGKRDMHPGYANVAESEAHTFALIKQIEASPLWKDSIILVTFDDAGGFWDHVPPPRIDRFGPGIRIPTLIISPFAKRGYIDHTTYDTTSILKLIELKFGLQPLAKRDAEAGDLTNALK